MQNGDLDDFTFWDGYTIEQVAEELVDECEDLSEFAQRYFDYAAFARDLEFDNFTETSGGVLEE